MTRKISLFFCIFMLLLTACSGGGGDSDKTLENRAPRANITSVPIENFLGETIIFSGEQSSDPDNDPLVYQWSVLDENGNVIAESSVNSEEFAFEPETTGTFQLKLVVNDGVVDSAPSVFEFTVQMLGEIEAEAGEQQQVKIGDKVYLNAEGSHSSNSVITSYQWQFSDLPPNSQALLNNNTSVAANFTPDQSGTYVVTLTITDEYGNTSTDDVVIEVTAQAQNSIPMAIVTSATSEVSVGELVVLSAQESSDADGDSLTYSWQLGAPEGSSAALSSTVSTEVSFTADIEGDYRITLVVSDQESDSLPAEAIISAAVDNQSPVALAGGDLVATQGESIELNAGSSYDPDGNPLTYFWKFVSLPSDSEAVLVNQEQVVASFVPDVAGDYIVELSVSDGVKTSTDTVKVELPSLARPVAAIEGAESALVGELVTLNASSSTDPQGLSLTYQWSLVSAAGGETLSSIDAEVTEFTPLASGTYIVGLVVSNGSLSSEQVTLSISVEELSNEIVTGKVTGTLVDTSNDSISGVVARIEGTEQIVEVMTDSEGNFEADVSIETNNSFTITFLTDKMSAEASYESSKITEDGFTLGIGQLALPLDTPIDLTVSAGYAGYNGPQEINVRFAMVEGIADEHFSVSYNRVFQVMLDRTYQLVLPSEANYQITSDEGLKFWYFDDLPCEQEKEYTQPYSWQGAPQVAVLLPLVICE